jgi:hypothetical protein
MSKFETALDVFEGSLFGMSLVAGRSLDLDEATHDERRSRCIAKFEELRCVWNHESETLKQLEKLVLACVEAFENDDLETGNETAKDIEKAIWSIRNARVQ